MGKSTIEIENEMAKAKDIEEIEAILEREGIGNTRFCDRLVQLCDEKKQSSATLLEKMAISKSQLCAIRNGTRNPSRETVIKLALALELSLEETNELLKLAGYKELYAKNQDDAIIAFGLRKKLDVYQINELLKSKNSKINLLDE